MSESTCAVDGCKKNLHGRGMCHEHYRPKVERICLVDDCDLSASKVGSGRGWCSKHYQRWKRNGDPVGLRPKVVGVAECSVSGCSGLVHARNWCMMHYTRWVRYGDPEVRLRGEIANGCRVCPNCGRDKPLSEYTAGKVGRCKACNASVAAQKRMDPEVRRAVNEAARVYAAANRAEQAARAKEWRSHNPEKVRAQAALYRARKYASSVESFVPLEVFIRDEWICGICEDSVDSGLAYPDPMSASLDHVIPLSRGGAHGMDNCQLAHLVCNIKKGARVK